MSTPAITHLPRGRALYLLHFAPRYQHAGHYLGYAEDVARRLGEHFGRGSKASPLVRAALEAGCSVAVARLWPGGTRTLERRLKRSGGLSRHCPICRETGSYHR